MGQVPRSVPISRDVIVWSASGASDQSDLKPGAVLLVAADGGPDGRAARGRSETSDEAGDSVAMRLL